MWRWFILLCTSYIIINYVGTSSTAIMLPGYLALQEPNFFLGPLYYHYLTNWLNCVLMSAVPEQGLGLMLFVSGDAVDPLNPVFEVAPMYQLSFNLVWGNFSDDWLSPWAAQILSLYVRPGRGVITYVTMKPFSERHGQLGDKRFTLWKPNNKFNLSLVWKIHFKLPKMHKLVREWDIYIRPTLWRRLEGNKYAYSTSFLRFFMPIFCTFTSPLKTYVWSVNSCIRCISSLRHEPSLSEIKVSSAISKLPPSLQTYDCKDLRLWLLEIIPKTRHFFCSEPLKVVVMI